MNAVCAAPVPVLSKLLVPKELLVAGVPDEMEKHLPELQHDVAVTNDEYQKYLQRAAAQAAQELQKQKAERESIEDVKSRLKF